MVSCSQANPDPSVKYADVLIEEILDLAETICDAGQEFADSVVDRTDAIEDAVIKNRGATEGQLTALENMRDGLLRWHRE